MKTQLLFALTLFSFFAFGQNRNINANLEKIISKSRLHIATDISTIDLLEKTWKNGQQTWTIEEEILLKSVLSEAYLLKDDRKALELAKETFDLAEKEFGQTNHPYLGSAFITKLFYYKRRNDFEKAITLGEQAKSIISTSTPEFDRFAYLLNYCYANIDRYQKISHEFLNFWEAAIKTNNKLENEQSLYYFNAAKTLYYLHVEANNLKASLLSIQLLSLPAINRRVQYEVHYPALISLSHLAQFELEELYENKMTELLPIIKLDEIDEITHNHLFLTCFHLLDGKRHQMQSLADANMKKSITFKDEAPLILGRSYSDLAFAYYNRPQKNKSLETAQQGLRYGDSNGELAYRIAASQFHTLQFDSALVYFQKRLCELDEVFNSMDLSQNPYPPKEELYTHYYSNISNSLRWKCRAFYRKSLLTKDDDEAVKLLLNGVEAGNASVAYLNTYIEGHYPFYYNSFLSHTWNHVTYGFTMLCHYELYKRGGKEMHLKKVFETIEKAKTKLMYKMLSEPDLPLDVAKYLNDKMFRFEESIRAYQLSPIQEQDQSIKLTYQHVEELEQINDSLRLQYPDKTFSYKPIEVIETDEIQATLDDKTVVLNFKEVWNHGISYLISADTQMVKYFKVDDEWRNSLAKLNKMLSHPAQAQSFRRQKIIKHANKIYKTILAPFEKELSKASNLIILPDRGLFYIPFEILLANDEVKPYHELDFLIKRYHITYYTSATFMQKNKKMPAIKDNSLLAFAPVFKDNYSIPNTQRSVTDFGKMRKVISGIDDNEFAPLINSKLEVEGISKIIPNTSKKNILLNNFARKQPLIKALEEKPYQFIHLATHGFVNFYNPTLNGLACYNQDGKDENFLYAAEVESMDIKADLVVLSSCESGIGHIIEGESLMAMNRSFFQAGAKNVLFSLWKVNDEQTKNLMLKFYTNVSKDMSYATALRKAKLELLKDPHSASPRFWAAFILFGE